MVTIRFRRLLQTCISTRRTSRSFQARHMTQRPGKRLFGSLASTEASAAVEYSVVLGVLGAMVIAGVVAVGAVIRHSAKNLTSVNPSGGQTIAGNGAENSVAMVATADAIAASRVDGARTASHGESPKSLPA